MKKLLKWILRLGIVSGILGLLVLAGVYLTFGRDLPDVETLRDVQLQVPLRVYSRDGKLISVFGEKRRIPADIDEIPVHLRNAFIAGEDARFYKHPGVDYQGFTRAVITLATTGEKSVGGSTITQMLARNYFLTLDKTYERKIREIFLALQIEREFSKDEILELFLNKILLGHRAYGVGAAADVYYGKQLSELTLAQSAMIAALPKAPSRINPITSPERALERRNYVLSRMLELEFITEGEYETAFNAPDNAFYHGATTELRAPYLSEMVRAAAIERLGNDAYTGGYVIHTTIDSRMQEAATDSVRAGLEAYDRRHGYRGPEAKIDLSEAIDTDAWDEALAPYRALAGFVPGLVTESDEELALIYLEDGRTVALGLEHVAWAKKFISRERWGHPPEHVNQVLNPGDIVRVRLQDDGSWILGQLPDAEAALISMDPNNGALRALVGGYDFARSKYNRITQSRRQPGSSFKPFVYSAALERGFTTSSLINDAPIVFEDDELERTWKPQNFSEKFFGPTRLREAMVNSRNLVSIRLLRSVGVRTAREYIANFGFAVEDLPPNLSMALGSASLPPLQMARGYSVFANGGHLVDPFFIQRIVDGNGKVIFQADPATVCETNCEEPRALAVSGNSDSTQRDTPVYRPLEVGGEADGNENRNADWSESDAANNLGTREAPQVISEQNAYLIRSMMTDVINRGTGKMALELGRTDLAGKTGTTNDQRDAWFSGYNSHLVTSVWVGFDNHETLGRAEVGGRAALPIWVDFMGVALQDIPDDPRPMPAGIVRAKIDPQSGLLAALDTSNGIMEVFQAGRLPEMEATEGVQRDDTTEEDPYDIY